MSCSIAPTKVKSTVHPYNNIEIHCALWLAVALGLGAQELWNAEYLVASVNVTCSVPSSVTESGKQDVNLQYSWSLNEPTKITAIHLVLHSPSRQLIPLITRPTIDGYPGLCHLIFTLSQVGHYLLSHIY